MEVCLFCFGVWFVDRRVVLVWDTLFWINLCGCCFVSLMVRGVDWCVDELIVSGCLAIFAYRF